MKRSGVPSMAGAGPAALFALIGGALLLAVLALVAIVRANRRRHAT